MNFDRSFSFYLFARPSVLDGAARSLDLGGVFDSYNDSFTSSQADSQALLHDWMMVGFDIHSAILEYGEKKEVEKNYASN